MKDKFIGCLVGAALGDAIGEIAQHQNELSTDLIINRTNSLNYTDDTAMSIGVAEFLLQEDFTKNKLGDIFLKNINKEPDRGYGGVQTLYYVAEINNISYDEACKKVDDVFRGGNGSYGDGAAMRIAPAALLFNSDPLLYEKTQLISSIDHNHPIGIDSAAVLAYAISMALKNRFDTEIYCQLLIDCAKTKEVKKNMIYVLNSLMNNTPAKEVDLTLGNITRSIADAHKAVPFAIFSFLKNKKSFKDTIEMAISSQGDADTIASMAGALSGAFLGIKSIHQNWILKLENYVYIRKLATQLFEKSKHLLYRSTKEWYWIKY
jgi:poly(ADP-ribose) glycohydrolase ARH3